MRALDGRWFELDASVMAEDPGSVAVVIQPAGPDGIREALLRALGLSARERQVARLSAHGQSAKEVARELQISPWTVQDHLKAIYAKTGRHLPRRSGRDGDRQVRSTRGRSAVLTSHRPLGRDLLGLDAPDRPAPSAAAASPRATA